MDIDGGMDGWMDGDHVRSLCEVFPSVLSDHERLV